LEKAVKAGVEKIGFDRSGYLYHGRVKIISRRCQRSWTKILIYEKYKNVELVKPSGLELKRSIS
jgi:hypothetical protein